MFSEVLTSLRAMLYIVNICGAQIAMGRRAGADVLR